MKTSGRLEQREPTEQAQYAQAGDKITGTYADNYNHV